MVYSAAAAADEMINMEGGEKASIAMGWDSRELESISGMAQACYLPWNKLLPFYTSVSPSVKWG